MTMMILVPNLECRQAPEEDDFNFNERFSALKAEFEAQLVEEAELNQAIIDNLARVVI